MKRLLIISISIFMLYAGGVKGSKKLLTTPTAKTLKQGQFVLASGLNFFTQAFSGSGAAGFNYWQVDGDLSFSYGLSSSFDLSLNTRLYQDTQRQDKNNFPSFISLDAKFGNVELGSKSFLAAGGIGFQFGIGNHYNLPYENYVSEGMTIKPEAVFSYYFDKYLPDRSVSVHASFGVDIGFDNGNIIEGVNNKSKTNVDTLSKNTSRLNYGLGISIPTDVIDILFEIDGYSYLTEPTSILAYGRESRTMANLGFRYKLSPFLSFDFGFGFNVAEGTETTVTSRSDATLLSDENSSESSFSGYSSWRGFLGINFSLQPSGSYGLSRTEIERNEYQRKIQTFKTLIEEQENTELIEQELDNLKKEREKAEKELEELKKILED